MIPFAFSASHTGASRLDIRARTIIVCPIIWREGIEDYYMLEQILRNEPTMRAALQKRVTNLLEDSHNPEAYRYAREWMIGKLNEQKGE